MITFALFIAIIAIVAFGSETDKWWIAVAAGVCAYWLNKWRDKRVRRGS